jgi:anti-anti-sigma regulatory factor
MNDSGGWHVDVDQGTDWLYLRPHAPNEDALQDAPLADMLWQFAQERSAFWLIIDLETVARLNSYLVGQLMLIHKRAHLNKGRMRLCGVSSDNYRVIEALRLVDRFPHYATRSDAEMGVVKESSAT